MALNRKRCGGGREERGMVGGRRLGRLGRNKGGRLGEEGEDIVCVGRLGREKGRLGEKMGSEGRIW